MDCFVLPPALAGVVFFLAFCTYAAGRLSLQWHLSLQTTALLTTFGTCVLRDLSAVSLFCPNLHSDLSPE